MSDWGQGAKNNNIGWGQGAVNNDISWGKSHELSYSGDTDIVGARSLLLDLYPNAAAAYSLRRLNSDYTGDAIRVRRASDNTELNIGFVNNELDVASLETFCSGTDGFVTTWYDQSGEGNDATQTTAASQPKIYDSVTGVVLENGKPAVDFDGTNYLLNNITDNYSNYSELAVAKSLTNLIATALIAHSSGDTQVTGYLGTRNDGENWGTFDGGNRIFGSISGNLDLISRYKNLSNNIFNYVNSVLGDVYNSNTISTPALIGAFITNPSVSLTFTGAVAEIIIFPSDQFANRTQIETNINDYYEIY